MSLLSDTLEHDVDVSLHAWSQKVNAYKIQYLVFGDKIAEPKIIINQSDKQYSIGDIAICDKSCNYDGWVEIEPIY